ncbi:MAG: AhpC/TSA family protein [Saprospiraceae bacterium]|jgi:peroxiredoxin|nr:AhpC/TSA family protein [Saprospiraceae bacterium]MBL0024507.1 AhpC/TSA family protein [Saprospiraceae bacterium]
MLISKISQIVKTSLLITFLGLTASLAKAQIPEKPEDISPLLIGESIPDVTLWDAENQAISLAAILKAKPTVLVFYRGGWCPFCNVQLSSLARSQDEILKLGYQIVAVSPEDYQNIEPTKSNDKLNYSVYSDQNATLMKQIGIAFKMSQKSAQYISNKTKGTLTEILPVPSVFILNTSGKILFEYINPDYKTRMSDDLLMAVLKAIK